MSFRSELFLSWSRIYVHFMKPEASLPGLIQLAICPHLEPDKSSPCLPILFLEICLTVILPSVPRSFKRSLSFSFSHQNCVYFYCLLCMFMYPTCLILFNWITLIYDEEYMSWRSLCGFLYPPVTPWALYSWKQSVCVLLPSMWQGRFQTYVKQIAKL